MHKPPTLLPGHLRYATGPGILTTASLAALTLAIPGFITVSMIRNLSSKWAEELFIALIVSHSPPAIAERLRQAMELRREAAGSRP